MTDDHRERRLGDASDLQDAIDALGRVPKDHRAGFLHDRLMSAIDDICKKHAAEGRQTFTKPQLLAIKDVAFQIVYILDPKSRRPRGFLRVLWAEFREQSAMKQVGTIAVVVSAVVAMVGGAVTFYEKYGRSVLIPATQQAAPTPGVTQQIEVQTPPAPPPLRIPTMPTPPAQ